MENLKLKKQRISLLVYGEVIAETVYDHINSFANFSENKIDLIDLSNPREININKFMRSDVIVVHYTVSLLSDQRFPLRFRLLLKKFKNLKVIFIQDEYRLVNRIHAALNFLEIDAIFTCIPEHEIEKVYPAEKLPYLKKKINVLTGYVPENLKPLFHTRPPYQARKLDVVYRARKLSAQYGSLAQEKWTIVRDFSRDAEKYNLKVDLSYSERARIYGKKWTEFLRSSKAALGVESGASVFDFTGEIRKNVEAYEKNYPNASFAEIERIFFPGLDNLIYVNQISPRCFECAALGTLMILYEGNYSGILKPWRHYVPLKKDHSNIEEVVAALRDPKLWQTITEQAYNEVALNDKYSYKVMIAKFDQVVAEIAKNGYVYIPEQLEKNNNYLLRKIAKHAYIFLQKTKLITIALKIKSKLDRHYESIRILAQVIHLAINNSIHISRKDFFRIVKLSSLMSNAKCPGLKHIFIETCILDKFLQTHLKGSPFVVDLTANEISIRFAEDNAGKIGFLDRMLAIKNLLLNTKSINISFPETLYLSEKLSGLNLQSQAVG